MAARRKRWRFIVRAIGILLFSTVGLGILLLLALFLVGRSDWGRGRILSIVVPAVRKSLIGELRIGALDGDLTHMLVLRNVEISDAEGQVALRLFSVGLRYNLLGLLGRTLHITKVDARGEVRARHLADGRLNLSALLRPSPPSSGPLPLRIVISGIAVDLSTSYDALAQNSAPLPHAEARLHIAGDVALGRDFSLKLDLQDLSGALLVPAQAALRLQGGVTVQSEPELRVALRHLKIFGQTTGEDLTRLVPTVPLRGKLGLSAELDGTLAALNAGLSLELPTGKITAQGKLQPQNPSLPWELQMRADSVDPSVYTELPAGRIDLELWAKGLGPSGRVNLQRLQVAALASQVQANGFLEIPPGWLSTADWQSLQSELHCTWQADDLAAWEKLGAPALGGALQGTALVQLANHSLQLNAKLHGQSLRSFGVSLAQLDLNVAAKGTPQTPSLDLNLWARELLAQGMHFSQLELGGSVNRQALTLSASGQGPEQVAFGLSLSGRPEFAENSLQLHGLDSQIKELRLSRANQTLLLEHPARIAVNLRSAPILDVEPLALLFGRQRIALSGHFEAQTQRLSTHLDASHLNLRELAQVVGLGQQIPETELAIKADVTGTLRAPSGHLSLSGEVGPPPQLPLRRTEWQLLADLDGQKARGQLHVKMPGQAVGQATSALSAQFALPLDERAALSLDTTVETALPELAFALPDTLRSLQGALQLHAVLGGSRQRPQMNLRVELPDWHSAFINGKKTVLVVDYKQSQLAVALNAHFLNPDEKPLGELKFSAHAPLSLAPPLNGAAVLFQLSGAGFGADLALTELSALELWKLARPDEPPLRSGQLELNAQLQGPLLAENQSPTLSLQLHARDLGLSPRSGAAAIPAAATVQLHYLASRVNLKLDATLANKPLLLGNASAELPLAAVLRGGSDALMRLPLHATLDVLPTELPSDLPVRGQLRAHLQAQGTPSAPQALCDVQVGKLLVQDWLFGDATAQVRLNPAGLQVNAQVQQTSTKDLAGTIALVASAPLPFALTSEKFKVALQAHGYRFNYEVPQSDTTPSSGLMLLRGLLDAEINLQGQKPQPQVFGFVRFAQGELAAASLPQLFRDILVDVKLDASGLVTLNRLSATASGGHFSAEGNVQLDGLLVSSLGLHARSSAFPIPAGPIGLWLDSNIDISGKTRDGTLRTKVLVTKTQVRLPKLASNQSVQSLGPLEDVRFVDAAAKTAAASAASSSPSSSRTAAAPSASPPVGLPARTLITVELPPPLAISGPEVKTSMEGHLDIELAASAMMPIITGAIHTNGGWVDVMDGRYQIEKAQVSMSGEVPPNPLLDVLISRKLGDVIVYIRVSGSARAPQISFTSDPATYDESQIIMMIISGGHQRSGTMQQQAIGAISSLLVGQLKKQLGPLLPVDEVRLNAGGSDAMGMNQSSLEVGKYLRDNLYLLYTHRFGNWSSVLRRYNNDEVSLEWRFFTNYQINLMGGDQGVGALNLYWTKRF